MFASLRLHPNKQESLAADNDEALTRPNEEVRCEKQHTRTSRRPHANVGVVCVSDRGRSFVTQRSPYKGASFFVHYFLGDLENEDNDHILWLSLSKLSLRLRMHENTVYKAVNQMVDDGFLVRLDDDSNRRRGTPRRFRFVFPDVPVIFHPDRPPSPSDRVGEDDSSPSQRVGGHPATEWVAPSERVGVTQSESGLTKGEPKEVTEHSTESSSLSTIETIEDPPPVHEPKHEATIYMCHYLAEAMFNAGYPQPKISKSWLKHMDLLLRRGQPGYEPEEQDPIDVGAVIDWVVTDDFWSQNVQSPEALRKHWNRFVAKLRNAPKATSGPDAIAALKETYATQNKPIEAAAEVIDSSVDL